MKRSVVLIATLMLSPACVVPEPTDPVEPLQRTYEGDLEFDDIAMLDVDPSNLRSGSDPCHEPMLVEVTGVIDRDTFDFQGYQSGSGGRLRIIGVDAPEVGRRTPRVLRAGGRGFTCSPRHFVWLTFDQACRDSYNRVLGYVHLGREADMSSASTGPCPGQVLPRHGYLVGAFAQDQEDAQEAETGLWGACP